MNNHLFFFVVQFSQTQISIIIHQKDWIMFSQYPWENLRDLFQLKKIIERRNFRSSHMLFAFRSDVLAIKNMSSIAFMNIICLSYKIDFSYGIILNDCGSNDRRKIIECCWMTWRKISFFHIIDCVPEKEYCLFLLYLFILLVVLFDVFSHPYYILGLSEGRIQKNKSSTRLR